MEEGKYRVPRDEGEILPNKLGIDKLHELEQAELEGFLFASKVLFEELNEDTRFDLNYIYRLHRLALEHLYSFAGRLRTVNVSKGGFLFPPAQFLEQTMSDFEKGILAPLRAHYETKEQLVKDIAKVHAELLFIHPFREGNGRAARLLANLMAAKAGQQLLDLEDFRKTRFDDYILAIQQAANGNYGQMETIIRSLF